MSPLSASNHPILPSFRPSKPDLPRAAYCRCVKGGRGARAAQLGRPRQVPDEAQARARRLQARYPPPVDAHPPRRAAQQGARVGVRVQ
eukprot:4851810-Pleurochrysis_carterae.AAC.1